MEYSELSLPWAKRLRFNKDAFPTLCALTDRKHTSDFYSERLHCGEISARWMVHLATLEGIAKTLYKVLTTEDDDGDCPVHSAMVDWSTDSEDLPDELRDLATDEELDLLRDWWEDAVSEWEISDSPHDNDGSLMVRTHAWRGTYNSMPATVGELMDLLALIPRETDLVCDDQTVVRLERVGKFAVVEIGNESDIDDGAEGTVEALAQAIPPLV